MGAMNSTRERICGAFHRAAQRKQTEAIDFEPNEKAQT
jgi:hypothetical protein